MNKINVLIYFLVFFLIVQIVNSVPSGFMELTIEDDLNKLNVRSFILNPEFKKENTQNYIKTKNFLYL